MLETIQTALLSGGHALWLPLAVFVAGLMTSLTPCVYPMLPITVAVVGSRARSQLQAFAFSWLYVSGLALVYAALGVLAASSGQLFGVVGQSSADAAAGGFVMSADGHLDDGLAAYAGVTAAVAVPVFIRAVTGICCRPVIRPGHGALHLAGVRHVADVCRRPGATSVGRAADGDVCSGHECVAGAGRNCQRCFAAVTQIWPLDESGAVVAGRADAGCRAVPVESGLAGAGLMVINCAGEQS